MPRKKHSPAVEHGKLKRQLSLLPLIKFGHTILEGYRRFVIEKAPSFAHISPGLRDVARLLFLSLPKGHPLQSRLRGQRFAQTIFALSRYVRLAIDNHLKSRLIVSPSNKALNPFTEVCFRLIAKQLLRFGDVCPGLGNISRLLG